MGCRYLAGLSKLVACWLFVLFPLSARAADVTANWTGGDGSWSDAAGWSTSPDVPNNAAAGITYDVVLGTGDLVTADVSGVVIDGLFINGGLLRGPENVTVVNGGAWTSARLLDGAAVTVGPAANFNLSSNAAKGLDDQASLTVQGTLNLRDNGSLRSEDTGTSGVRVTLEATGTLDFQGDADLIGEFRASTYRKGMLTNAGIVKKSAGSGVSEIDGNWDFISTGKILVESGTLQFKNFNFGNTFRHEGTATVSAGSLVVAGGTSTGTYEVQAGAELRLNAHDNSLHRFEGGQLVNQGILAVDGNVSFESGADYSGAGQVQLRSGSLRGDVPLSFADWEWSGGRIESTGGVSVPSGGVAVISGSNASGSKQLGTSALLSIEGTLSMSASNNLDTLGTSAAPAMIHVAEGGVFDLQTDAGLSDGFFGFNTARAGQLTIEGQLTKTLGAGTSVLTRNWMVRNEGQVDVQTGAILFEGPVSGEGTFSGNGKVEFAGAYAPGDSAAAVSFAGDLEFHSAALLQIELGGSSPGSEFDVLEVAGRADLSGGLSVTLIHAFEPVLGQEFAIIRSALGIDGQFDDLSLPLLADSLLGWEFVYESNAVLLEVVQLDYAAADFNEDTFIDETDLTLWQSNYGTNSGALHGTGDSDQDADVDAADFLNWQRQLTGAAAPVASTATVPEPTSGVLLLTMWVLSQLRRAKKLDGSSLQLAQLPRLCRGT